LHAVSRSRSVIGDPDRPQDDSRPPETPISLLGWIPVGGVVGLGAGYLYGANYVMPGLVIGLAGGLGIALGLRRARR
jgi:hypothetical protein